MTIEVKSDGENLIFEDYQKRKITIPHEDYIELISSKERQAIRPALEDGLTNPDEVWWMVETIEGVNVSYYKYIKFYRDAAFIAYVEIDENLNFHLNNFYAFADENYEEVDKERCGQLILSKQK